MTANNNEEAKMPKPKLLTMHEKASKLRHSLDPRRCSFGQSRNFDYDDLEIEDQDLDVHSIQWDCNGRKPEVDATVENIEYSSPYDEDSVVINRELYKQLQSFLQDVEDSWSLSQVSPEFQTAMEQWNNIRMNNDGLPVIVAQLRWQELLRKEVALQKAQQLLCNE